MFGFLRFAALTLGMMAAFGSAQAQSWPERPIKIVTPFAAGGATDILARIVAEKLGDKLGQRVLIENRAGAGGNTGTAVVAKAEPDGYTLVLAAPGPFVINNIIEKLPYNPVKDFELITPMGALVNVLVVNPKKIPAKNVKEFIAYVKERPDQISYSSIGIGSSQHLAAAYFDIVAGTRMVHVPYSSAPQMTADLGSGDVGVSFQLIPNITAQLQGKQIIPLAVTTKTRSLSMPDVPTMEEEGVKDYESYAWFGLAAPKGTPKAVLDRLNRETVAIINDPAIRKRLIEIGFEPWATSADEFRAFIGEETQKWTKIIARAGIKAN